MWPFNRRETAAAATDARPAAILEISVAGAGRILARDPARLLRPGRDLRAADIDFLVLQVRDDVLGDVSKHLESAFGIVMGFDGTIVSTMSPVVYVVFGIPIHDDIRDHANECAGAAARLVAELGSNVRVVFGRANGLHGVMGSEQRFVYGTVVPNFTPILKTLTNVEFGKSKRI